MFLEYLKLNILHIVFLTDQLCECSLTAGNYLLSQTDTNYRDMPEVRDGYFTIYYAFNKIIMDVITKTFGLCMLRTNVAILVGHILLCSLYMWHYTYDNTDHILYKILKDDASHAYSIYNYEHE